MTRQLRVHAAAFVAKEVTPHEERWAQQHQVDRDVWNKAGAAGLLCLDVPEEFGGAGGNFGHESVVQQELVAPATVQWLRRALDHRGALHQFVRHRRAEEAVAAQMRHGRGGSRHCDDRTGDRV